MQVDSSSCTGCLRCIPYCPMDAIIKVPGQRLVAIDEDECVECTVCYRADVCASQSLYQQTLAWPRILRANFSDPKTEHKETGVPGRGTEEMKTNDVTGRYLRGRVGMAAELGRPGTGTRFYDVQKVAQAVAALGVSFEAKNPVTTLMVDRATGKLQDDVLSEKVLSAIVEFDADLEQVPAIMSALNRVAGEVDTVFSVGIISLVERDGSMPLEKVDLAAHGRNLSLNAKVNVGLGRPAARALEGMINESH